MSDSDTVISVFCLFVFVVACLFLNTGHIIHIVSRRNLEREEGWSCG